MSLLNKQYRYVSVRFQSSSKSYAYRTDKEALLLEDANRQGVKQRLDELEAFLEEQQEPVTDYDEGLVRRLIERITVYDDRLVFEFKSGLETEVQM